MVASRGFLEAAAAERGGRDGVGDDGGLSPVAAAAGREEGVGGGFLARTDEGGGGRTPYLEEEGVVASSLTLVEFAPSILCGGKLSGLCPFPPNVAVFVLVAMLEGAGDGGVAVLVVVSGGE